MIRCCNFDRIHYAALSESMDFSDFWHGLDSVVVTQIC
jgi:hypothetical protein